MAAPVRRGSGNSTPEPPSGVLLPSYTPIVAHYAPGPFLDEQIVTPSEYRWRGTRTYIVRDRTTRQEYRALRVSDGPHFVGYWAVELLPTPLDLGTRFEGDREDAIIDYTDAQEQKRRDTKRARTGKHHE